MASKYSILNWGIAGCGKISNDFVTAVQTDIEKNHQFVAAASRSLETALEFAHKFNIPKAYGSYQELALNDDVHVVYVGNLNVNHFDTAKLFLEHGKHVLLEKPLTMNAKQTENLIKFAKEKNLLLMEALWSRFLPSYVFVMDQIKNGAIGEVLYADATFGVPISQVPRLMKKELGGGTVLDLGVYTINLVQQVFGNEYPEQILATGNVNENGVDINFGATLRYKNGRAATISTHSMVLLPNEAHIVGTKGTIKLMSMFHCCQKVLLNGVEHDFSFPPATAGCFNFNGSYGLKFEAHEVRRLLIEQQIESQVMPHQDSILIAKIQDKIRQQIGVHFDADN